MNTREMAIALVDQWGTGVSDARDRTAGTQPEASTYTHPQSPARYQAYLNVLLPFSQHRCRTSV